MADISDDRKGLRVERDASGQWFAALPDGPNVGAWQKVSYRDLINMGLDSEYF